MADMKNEAAVALGKLGGEATKKKGSEYYRAISKKAHKVRWGKKRKKS